MDSYGILHDPPVPSGSLIELTDTGRTQALQSGHQRVAAARLSVDIDVHAILTGFALGHVLVEQSPTAANAAGRRTAAAR